MKETVLDWLPMFAEFVKDPTFDFSVGDFVEIEKSATPKAKNAYRKYIKFISHGLQSWDDLIIENRRIVGIAKTATGKSKEQCEIVLQLIADGWIDNEPFIKG